MDFITTTEMTIGSCHNRVTGNLPAKWAIFITKQSDKGWGGEYSLRYMKLQQGMTVDFSLFAFCDVFVKMGTDFKHFDL